jgi:succinyl-diaminopimelate desuccinylase
MKPAYSTPGSTSTSTSRCAFLQELVRVPTDTPPGNNAPHAERTGRAAQRPSASTPKSTPCPTAEVRAYGLQSITNLIVRRRYGEGGKTIALNAHGDVVPPGEGWTHDPTAARSWTARSTAAPPR